MSNIFVRTSNVRRLIYLHVITACKMACSTAKNSNNLRDFGQFVILTSQVSQDHLGGPQEVPYIYKYST